MALYAFDGTSNKDEERDELDSNVVKFKELYRGKVEYLSGVGTRMGTLGSAMGGLFGMGGRTRISEMYDLLCANYAQGDREIDIIGFSRGAALAVHFANKLAEEQIVCPDGSKVQAQIRFLGVWDIVASFGLSFNNMLNFQEINLGWDVDHVTDCVQQCYHAMALNERREAFNITRLDPRHQHANVEELWFRGVHSDIGGSNENPTRSNIALNWMLGKARASGLLFDESLAQSNKYSEINLYAQVMPNTDVFIDPRRKIFSGDLYHETAFPTLSVGEQVTVDVHADRKYNWSGIQVEENAKYQFTAKGNWKDSDISCDAAGWNTERLGWAKEKIVSTFEDNRRCPLADWFELIGAYGDSDDDLFRLGEAVHSVEITARRTAPLWLFANDLSFAYGNNKEKIQVTITRLS